MSAQATPRLVIDGGLFVTFEGGEGAGKSSAIAGLESRLKTQGFAVHVTREPGCDELGARLRSILLDPSFNLDELEELFLFAADRSHHVRQDIQPALTAGCIVLCDRYADSTFCYQGANPELVKTVQLLNQLATRGLWPERTYLLDVRPEIGLQRVAGRRGEASKFDDRELSFHDALRQRFLKLAESTSKRIVVIDAHQPAEAVISGIAADLAHILTTKTTTTLTAPQA